LEILVKDLLDLSRIEAVESKSGFNSLDINQLAREVGEQFASRAEQTDRSFAMQIPDGTLRMQGNELQLKRAVTNLLENALKFTPAGGSISLHLEQRAQKLIITISDSGIGIPPDDLPLLFERFHRARNASNFPGSGLGLSIVKAIVSNHEGNVEIHSQLGLGSRVAITLPFE
jgi:signal transduction histidine kinase